MAASSIIIGVARCERCEATAYEEIDETNGDLILGCCFCSARVRVKAAAVRRQIARQAESDFTFKSGRFKGMTLAEVDAEPNGRKYLEWIHSHDERLREVVARHLYS